MKLWVVIEMDGGYSGDPMYPSQIFGPFATEEAAYEWRRIQHERLQWRLREPQEIIPT